MFFIQIIYNNSVFLPIENGSLLSAKSYKFLAWNSVDGGCYLHKNRNISTILLWKQEGQRDGIMIADGRNWMGLDIFYVGAMDKKSVK